MQCSSSILPFFLNEFDRFQDLAIPPLLRQKSLGEIERARLAKLGDMQCQCWHIMTCLLLMCFDRPEPVQTALSFPPRVPSLPSAGPIPPQRPQYFEGHS